MILEKLLSLFYDGYTYGMPMLIIGYFFTKKNRSNILSFIGIANGYFSIYAFLLFLITLKELFWAWYSQNPYEGYTFQYSRANIFSLYGFLFWGQVISILLFAILYFFKKLRRKIWLSIFAILVLHFSHSSELFIIYSSLYRDYLPSSFSYYPSNIFRDALLGIIFFTFLISATYFIKAKLKRCI